MLSRKQLVDLESIEYFIPDVYRGVPITIEDKQDFLMFSDKGIIPNHRVDSIQFNKGNNGSKKDINISFFTGKTLNGYQLLFLGKSRRGLHVKLWEDGIMAGTHPLYTLVQDGNGRIPASVMEFMEKSLFKGLYSRKSKNESFKGRWYDAWESLDTTESTQRITKSDTM